MDPLREPFPAGATTSIKSLSPRPSAALVVLDSESMKVLDHPVDGARNSTLMLSGTGLTLPTRRVGLRHMAQRLLTLPGVSPSEQRHAEHCVVPLIRFDPHSSYEESTWTLDSTFQIDQWCIDRASISVQNTQDINGPVTANLAVDEWWKLIRILVSVDHWLDCLREVLTSQARLLRQMV
ncbi:MAG TPA: hypothetical protein VGL46_17675 [Pseudonocardiaceae bacterium]|jgi:hypothetical protein